MVTYGQEHSKEKGSKKKLKKRTKSKEMANELLFNIATESPSSTHPGSPHEVSSTLSVTPHNPQGPIILTEHQGNLYGIDEDVFCYCEDSQYDFEMECGRSYKRMISSQKKINERLLVKAKKDQEKFGCFYPFAFCG